MHDDGAADSANRARPPALVRVEVAARVGLGLRGGIDVRAGVTAHAALRRRSLRTRIRVIVDIGPYRALGGDSTHSDVEKSSDLRKRFDEEGSQEHRCENLRSRHCAGVEADNGQRARRTDENEREEAVHHDDDKLVAREQFHDGPAVALSLVFELAFNSRPGAKQTYRHEVANGVEILSGQNRALLARFSRRLPEETHENSEQNGNERT